MAIPLILGSEDDVILGAPTAAGKTEAVFLPLLTKMLMARDGIGSVLYISPLKALINDQWDRLESLCEELEIAVIPWHGDIAMKKKERFLGDPRGIVLITPESLESLFVNKGSLMPSLFVSLRCIVVDELHSFIGSERGKQLQSLMHRIESILFRRIPRIGLSATLGDMSLAASFLRAENENDGEVRIIVSAESHLDLRLAVRGILEADDCGNATNGPEVLHGHSSVVTAEGRIADYLFSTLHGSHNLVFPNSRQRVEVYADLLRRRCESEGIPNQFWPHHGNLAREIREETERALKSSVTAATAIATSTLELGIDIGAIRSVAQVGPPPSVAALRQRLGRSGRRKGESAILRAYCVEPELDVRSHPSDRLREDLVQTIAMIQLLLEGWCEPPRIDGLHASTLCFQLLSLIAERGGVTTREAWRVLVETGPFRQVKKDDFLVMLRELAAREILFQTGDGLLLHGVVGERLVNSYEFYTAFPSEDEFRIVHDGEDLGSMPVSRAIPPEMRLIFAGRRWKVDSVDEEVKIIFVVPDPGGSAPVFTGEIGAVHDKVRAAMRVVLASTDDVAFLDKEGRDLLGEARRYYESEKLDERFLVANGAESVIFTWRGDEQNEALAILLGHEGVMCTNYGLTMSANVDTDTLTHALRKIAGEKETDVVRLLEGVGNLVHEKWDWVLPAELLRKSYASSHLDFYGARETARIIGASKTDML